MTRFWWALGVLLVGGAVYYCLIPSDEVPQPFDLGDKLYHVIGHAAMAAYFSGLVARRSWWKIFVFLLLLGAGIEVAQSLMHVGRQADLLDILSNSAGAALGLLLGFLGLSRWPQWADWLLRRKAVP